MEYKQFGIYTNDHIISIVVEANQDDIFIVNYRLELYFKNKNVLSNKDINNWIQHNFNYAEAAMRLKNKGYSDFVKLGYLGQIENLTLQKTLKNIANKLWIFWCADINRDPSIPL